MDKSTQFYRLVVSSNLTSKADLLKGSLSSLAISQGYQVKIFDLYFLEGHLAIDDLQIIAESLICDPVTDHYILSQDGRVVEFKAQENDFENNLKVYGTVEVAFRPGVTDNTANQLFHAVERIGIDGLESVSSGKRYEFTPEISIDVDEIRFIAENLLVNETIQYYTIGDIIPKFIHPVSEITLPQTLDMKSMTDEQLIHLNQERRLALNNNEMKAIQGYFLEIGRDPTDAELETIAQTWSEHCVHKTFKAEINIYENIPIKPSQPLEKVPSIIKTFLQAATQKIAAPWVRSAFVDNAGVIAFDEYFDLSFKVETHNHPSAIEPFGGANTGIGGVVRDILGVSHRPIATTDVLCFGPALTKHEDLPIGVLHPTRIRDGVISGIEDYGNKLGLPTVNGAIYYHPGYISNPLVYCGCVGIGPVNSHPKGPVSGDRVILVGGRTGRDGLRGATFSSLTMDAQTGRVAGASVQIGDPITEKGVIEVITRARDLQLYNAVTDCGAGGLSSAVGEMGSELGAKVQLEKVPLKYAGLDPWEIWLSEAQERMVLAVPPENIQQLAEICETYWVEWSDIGEFVDTGKLQVFYKDLMVVDLENRFLHDGLPKLYLDALINLTPPSKPEISDVFNAEIDFSQILKDLLSHPNIASKEENIRVYDHLVRGSTIVGPLVGKFNDGPSDAAVLKPSQTKGWKGFVLANGINPVIGLADPYSMAVSVVDEAIRNAVAVGADPDRIAILDNFCWGSPRQSETLGTLVRAAQGCYDAAVHFKTPFISGKDSLNNEYIGQDGNRHSIPGTLLISSIALHPDVRYAVTMDLKSPGSRIYLLGDWLPFVKGSHAALILGERYFDEEGVFPTSQFPTGAPDLYRKLHLAMMEGLVKSAHDLSEGGIAVAAAEMAIAGCTGLQLTLDPLKCDIKIALFAETNGCFLVEVSEDHAVSFETHFKAMPFIQIGKVMDNKSFMVFHDGKVVLSLSIDDITRSFRS